MNVSELGDSSKEETTGVYSLFISRCESFLPCFWSLDCCVRLSIQSFSLFVFKAAGNFQGVIQIFRSGDILMEALC